MGPSIEMTDTDQLAWGELNKSVHSFILRNIGVEPLGLELSTQLASSCCQYITTTTTDMYDSLGNILLQYR